MAKYGTKLTTVGIAKLANAQVSSSKVQITHIAVGDGNGVAYTPTGAETALKREQWRGTVNKVEVSEGNTIIVEGIVPATVGGFTMREVGLYDADGVMIAIGNYPDTEKTTVASGVAGELILRTIIKVANTSAVDLTINTDLVTATKSDIDGISAQLAQTSQQVSLITKIAPPPNGVNDTVAIQVALNELVSGGKFLMDGNYIISSAIDVPANVEISGTGMDSTSINWLESDTSFNTNSAMLRFARNTGYKFSGLYDITLNQKRRERGLGDNQSYGAVIAGDRMDIKRVRIHNTFGPGITQASIDTITIENCEIYDTGHHPIYFSTGNSRYIKNVEIVNNKIGTPANLTTREFDANLIKFRHKEAGDVIANIRIENNKLGSARGASIGAPGVYVSTTTGTKCIIEDFIFEKNSINSSAETDTNMDVALYIGGNSIGKNILINRNLLNSQPMTNSYGIRMLVDDFTNSYNIAINNNTIDKCENGIDSNLGIVSENSIKFTKVGFRGIEGLLKSNFFYSSTNDAIAINQATFDIIENTIKMSGTGTTGIDFANSTGLFIIRNKINGATNGVRRPSKALSGCTINENIFVNCTNNYVNILNHVDTLKNNDVEHSNKLRNCTTADRPTARYIGELCFDTSLRKIISWTGTAWVDATGTTV